MASSLVIEKIHATYKGRNTEKSDMTRQKINFRNLLGKKECW